MEQAAAHGDRAPRRADDDARHRPDRLTPIDTRRITGLVLAGGRGSRLGGVDKGLQPYRGEALALHALRRLAPQVERVAINANRNHDAYAALGAPVWADSLPDHPGPLAGFLAGLAQCETPYLATVPCDSPLFPLDLVQRLAAPFADARVEIALAATRADGAVRAEPVFSLLRTDLHASLAAFLGRGGRKVEAWAMAHRCELVVFDDAAAFLNVNTAADLQALQAKR